MTPRVVLLRGMNVGGHRRLRPTDLANQLAHLGVVNVGAAGTFVVRGKVGVRALREEFARRLPFDAEIVICRGADFVRMFSSDVFRGERLAPGETRFVSVSARRPSATPTLPLRFPSEGAWLLKVVTREGRFVYGVYRRHMKVIGYLNGLDRVFGVPLTTRNWTTVAAIVRALEV